MLVQDEGLYADLCRLFHEDGKEKVRGIKRSNEYPRGREQIISCNKRVCDWQEENVSWRVVVFLDTGT